MLNFRGVFMSNEIPKSEHQDPHGPLVARLTWAMFGPGFLMSLLIAVMLAPEFRLIRELCYVAVVVAMIIGRYAEQKSGRGTTLQGEPSTWAHFRMYVTKLVIFSAVLWFGTKYGAPYISPNAG
jgi:hypothetical protein